MTGNAAGGTTSKNAMPRLNLLAGVLLVMLAVAAAYHFFRVPPEEQSAAVDDSPSQPERVVQIPIEMLETPAEYREVDVAALNTIQTVSDVAKKREALINFLWGGSSLPDSLPAEVVKAVADERYADLAALDEIDKLVVRMEYGLESVIYYFHPTVPNGEVMLFHQGHRGDFHLSKHQINAFLERGYSVVAFSMPLLGMNNRPVIQLPRFGNLKLIDHDNMKFLQPATGHPLQYFVEPVVVAINYLLASKPDTTISFTGISGGAWTATIVAAIDSRVTSSFPVAGSYPMYLRSNSRRDWGDYEQTVPEFYRIANYLELYTLGAAGPGRLQLQILNQLDPCCFAGPKWETYASHVEARVTELGSGTFRLFMDDTHMEHQISDVAMDQIIQALENWQ